MQKVLDSNQSPPTEGLIACLDTGPCSNALKEDGGGARPNQQPMSNQLALQVNTHSMLHYPMLATARRINDTFGESNIMSPLADVIPCVLGVFMMLASEVRNV